MGPNRIQVYGHTMRTLFDFAESIGFVVGDLFGAVCPDLETWELSATRLAGTGSLFHGSVL
jgi:hypothetical protein